MFFSFNFSFVTFKKLLHPNGVISVAMQNNPIAEDQRFFSRQGHRLLAGIDRVLAAGGATDGPSVREAGVARMAQNH